MASVAAKTRAKRDARKRAQSNGVTIPRKTGVDRYVNGRIKAKPKVEKEADIKRTGLEARQRVHGVAANDADTKEAGSVMGRLILGGHLATGIQARHMGDAAEHFEKTHRAFTSAIGNSRLATSTDYTGHRANGHSGDVEDQSYIDWCNKARQDYAEVRRAILECGDPLAMTALEMVVLQDKNPSGQIIMGALRCGLNAVHRVQRSARRG